MADPICRCKFILNAVRTEMHHRRNDDGELEDIPSYDLEFRAVYAGGDPDPNNENAKFWDATPSGKFHFKTVDKDIAEDFTMGEAYYVDFIPADS